MGDCAVGEIDFAIFAVGAGCEGSFLGRVQRGQEQDAMQLCGCGIAQIYRSLAIFGLGLENDIVLLIAEGFV
jgi:hypothetical protein